MHLLNNLSWFISTINCRNKIKFDDECNKDLQFDCQMRVLRRVGLTREGYKSIALSHEQTDVTEQTRLFLQKLSRPR